MEIYPGLFLDGLYVPMLFLIAWPYACLLLVLTVAGIFIARLVRKGRPARLGPLLSRAVLASAILASTFTLMRMDVLHVWGFSLSRPAFERLLATAPPAPPIVGRATPLGRFVGIYWIDEYGFGSDGGVFFRYGTGIDGFFETMSFGLCYRPGEHTTLPGSTSQGDAEHTPDSYPSWPPQITPFGSASYRLTPIDSDWHWFAVSNDY